jgi:hypothetical protein
MTRSARIFRRAAVAYGAVIVTALSAATVYIHPSSAWQISSWRYFKGTAEPPASWMARDFDDSAWTSGKAPFGYGLRGHVRYGTPLTDMKTGYTTVFLRKHFYVDDFAKTGALKLSVNCSDGFVAWINGVEVAARNAPARRSATAVATASHPASTDHRYNVFSIPRERVALGRNVAAVMLLSHARDAESTHFDASLVDTRNLAFQQTATVSSVERNARFFQPAEAVDGTQLTFWSSEKKTESAPGWFAVDLGRSHTIDKIRLHWWGGELPGLGGGARDYDVQVSIDARDWKTVATLTNQNGGEDEVVFPSVGARHVRLQFAAANNPRGYNYGLLDLEVMAEGVPFDAREFESLALFKPATASAQNSRGSPAKKAFDNNAASWWQSLPGGPDPQWLAVDLEAVHRISAAKIYFTDRYAQRFVVQLATRENDWRDAACAIDTEEIPGGDNHRIHRVMFAEVQEARYARILLWGTNPHVKEYGERYTPTEFMVIAAPPAGAESK